MKRICVVICVAAVVAMIVAPAVFAQNLSAYFKLDTDLSAAGFQGTSSVMGVGAGKNVGFAVYAMSWDPSRAFTIAFEWDGAKAAFRESNSSTEIFDDDMNINGEDVTLAAEANFIGSSFISAGKVSETGYFENSYTKEGAGASSTPDGLLYFAVLRTSGTFTTDSSLAVKVMVTAADANSKTRYLGERWFYVNQQVDVQTSTWGNVKKQFKDF